MTPEQSASAYADREEIARLIESASEMGELDGYNGKRESPRVVDSLQLEVTPDPDGPKRSTAVSMHNVSATGCAFWIRKKLRVGETVFLREFSGDNSRSWLSAHITHCTLGIRGYMIGTSFNLMPDVT
jgi:hypothetical protein